MRPSAPIPRLKRRARLRARETGRPLHETLDAVAAEEGFRSWSHLSAAAARAPSAETLLRRLRPGDLALIGARPLQGKTRLGLELAARAATHGRTGFFFTLHDHAQAVAARLETLGLPRPPGPGALVVDASDDVSAGHAVRRMREAAADGRPALAVIDYLQILDQRRAGPCLQTQMEALRDHARRSGAICVALAQIDRAFELSGRAMPGPGDVRLPNPLDLSLFDMRCFLHGGEMQALRAA